jgi:hypothetical protein
MTAQKTTKVAALANKSVLCPVRAGFYAQGKAKHAAAGAFCAPRAGRTLLRMTDAATRRDQENHKAGLQEIRLECQDGDIAAPKNTPASLGHGYKAQDVKSLALPQETITACLSLGRVLRQIRARMLSEGYNVPKGKAPEDSQLS